MSTLQALEIVPRLVPLRGQDWELRLDDVVQVLTNQTRAIVVNTPGNASGKVFNQQDLERLADLAQQQDVLIFTDEIYEYFLYDQREHVSIASLAGMADRTITIPGNSKTFGMTGWRIGHSVASAPYAELIGAMNDLLYVCAPAPLQYGVAVGIQKLGSSFYQEVQRTFQRKRDQFCEVLERVGLSPTIPQGAYYVLADVSRLPGATGNEWAMYVLEKNRCSGRTW